VTRPANKRIAKLSSEVIMRSLGLNLYHTESYASGAAAAAIVREFATCIRNASRDSRLDFSEFTQVLDAIAVELEQGRLEPRAFASSCLHYGQAAP
jgi:seryl-tRNA(Sec) selenium transferase